MYSFYKCIILLYFTYVQKKWVKFKLQEIILKNNIPLPLFLINFLLSNLPSVLARDVSKSLSILT